MRKVVLAFVLAVSTLAPAAASAQPAQPPPPKKNAPQRREGKLTLDMVERITEGDDERVRSPVRVLLAAMLLTITAGLAATGCADGPPPISRTAPTSQFPTVATNDFHPQGQDLSNCGPGAERPGCGSAGNEPSSRSTR